MIENLKNIQDCSKKIAVNDGIVVPEIITASDIDKINRFTLFDPPDGTFLMLSPNLINEPDFLIRNIVKDDSLKMMCESFLGNGMINPVTVGCKDGQIIIIAGNRRLFAAKSVGMKFIPCIVKKGDPIILSLIENTQRQDLTPIQEAELYLKIKAHFGWSQKRLAKKLKMSTSNINAALKINELPDEIKNECRYCTKYSRRFFLEILRKKTSKSQIALFSRKKAKLFSDALKSPDETDEAKSDEEEGQGGNNRRAPHEILADKFHSSLSTAKRIQGTDLSREQLSELITLYTKLGEKLRKIGIAKSRVLDFFWRKCGIFRIKKEI